MRESAAKMAAGNDDGPDDDTEAVSAAVVVEDFDGGLTDLAEIARTVHVVVDSDGSVVVEGIPASVAEELREVVAHIAADATIRHVERALRVRLTPSRSDRRLWTKAAREALVAEAKRRRNGPAQQAA